MVSTALMCMALNVYFEARGEDRIGQYAVALVTMNRAKERKQSVCEVVTAKKQFSWTIDALKPVKQKGRFIGYQLKYNHIPKDMVAWEKAVSVSRMVMSQQVSDITYGANHYHAPYARKRSWMNEQYIVTKIGNHIFYRLG